MEWLVSNRVTSQGSCLGWKEGNIYVPSPDCQGDLLALERELSREDLVTRNVRCSLGLSHVTQKDLIPLLIHAQDKNIISVAIRILVNLTLPVECLLPLDIVSQTPSGQETICQLQTFLRHAQKAFLNVQATAAIVKTIRDILYTAELANPSILDCQCNDVNNCLLLLRNILHIPDKSDLLTFNHLDDRILEWQNLQNKLVWNLFAQGLDVALLLMLNNKNKASWTISTVQLLALLYKDQNVNDFQNLLSQEPDESDTSDEDIESDGSKGSGGNSSSCDSGCPQSSDAGGHDSSSHCWNTHRLSHLNTNNCAEDQNTECHSALSCDNERNPSTNNCRKVACRRRYSTTTMVADSRMEKHFREDHGNGKLKSYPMEDNRDNLDSSGFSNGMSSSSEDETKKAPEETMERRTSVTYNNNLIIMTNSAAKHRSSNSKKTNCESDSSNEDDSMPPEPSQKGKSRSHPPVGRKARSIAIGKGLKCSPRICFDAAEKVAAIKGKTITKAGLLQRKKVPRMLAINLTHDPTNDDISNLLKDFTLRFLHNGFADLVIDLKKIITAQNSIIIDKSHFLWLLTYFLKLSSILSLNFHHVRCILSSDIISYLTFEGVLMCEEFNLFLGTPQTDIKPLLRRMHLLVTAFREVLSFLDDYSKKPISKTEKALFHQLRCQIAEMNDVRQVFLLLIRNYNPMVHSKQYLVDVITTNHTLLILLERVAADDDQSHKFQLDLHLKQFANVKVMEQFGQVLEDFKTNSELVNDCVFTIMHHVAGDLKAPQALFQPSMLKLFCKILEEAEAETFQILPFWEELMTYVLNKFIRVTERSPQASVRKLFGLMTVNSDNGTGNRDSSICTSSWDNGSSSASSSQFKLNDKEDALYWWYLQFEHDKDPVGQIVESMSEHRTSVSRLQVIQDLLSKGVVTRADYENLKDREKAQTEEKRASEAVLCKLVGPQPDSVQSIVLELTQAGMKQHLVWLQNVLLESCYVQLGGQTTRDKPPEDPIPYYSMMSNQSIPLVPYNDAQETALHSHHFIQLLQKLGFHHLGDVGKVYPRIPSGWTANELYSVASQLGPINEKALKFQLNDLAWSTRNTKDTEAFNDEEKMDISKPDPFLDRKLAPLIVTDSWICVIQKSKTIRPALTAADRSGFS